MPVDGSKKKKREIPLGILLIGAEQPRDWYFVLRFWSCEERGQSLEKIETLYTRPNFSSKLAQLTIVFLFFFFLFLFSFNWLMNLFGGEPVSSPGHETINPSLWNNTIIYNFLWKWWPKWISHDFFDDPFTKGITESHGLALIGISPGEIFQYCTGAHFWNSRKSWQAKLLWSAEKATLTS